MKLFLFVFLLVTMSNAFAVVTCVYGGGALHGCRADAPDWCSTGTYAGCWEGPSLTVSFDDNISTLISGKINPEEHYEVEKSQEVKK